jgi:MFS transporter, OPA family, sugar phosphate sensor protein UhpC
MLKNLIRFYSPSASTELKVDKSDIDKIYRNHRWSIILTTTLGYSMYYICRLSFNVMKKPIIDEGLYSETQIGIIGSALFFTYAVGKFTNGFLTDRANIKRFMATGIFISAIINLILGFYHGFYAFILLWGLNGWFQSMGATPCAVALTRWYSYKELGTYWGFWSTSYNLGESLTFILTAFVVTIAGWRLGFETAGIIGLIASIDVQVFFLAGLMVIDFAPKKAVGAVLGIAGIASYVDAGIQDIVSGYLIGHYKTLINGSDVYQFFPSSIFWIGASTLSFILALTLWNIKPYKN